MLVIRLQRTGRKGQARFRLVVQESHRAPTSGRVIANLGYYNPHSKDSQIDTEKAKTYLKNGAQPSSRAIRLLKANKIKLPQWVEERPARQRPTKNPTKLRRHQPETTAADDQKKTEEAKLKPVESDSATEADQSPPNDDKTKPNGPDDDPTPAADAEPADKTEPAADKPTKED